MLLGAVPLIRQSRTRRLVDGTVVGLFACDSTPASGTCPDVLLPSTHRLSTPQERQLTNLKTDTPFMPVPTGVMRVWKTSPWPLNTTLRRPVHRIVWLT